MTNPKGTYAETHLCRWLTDQLGLPFDREPKRGNRDTGDIGGLDWLMIECKNTQTVDLKQWALEVARQVANKGAEFGVLIWSPPGVGTRSIDRWVAFEWASTCLPEVFQPRGVPHIGPLNKLHRFVEKADPWGPILMDAAGGVPDHRADTEVTARLLGTWVDVLRDEVIGRSVKEVAW